MESHKVKKIYTYKSNKFKIYQLPCGIENLNYLMGHILYQIFKILLTILSKNMKHLQILFPQEYT